MALLSASSTSPVLVVSILVLSSASFPLVIAIWIIQAQDGRRHYALSLVVFWLLVVAFIGILEQTLLQPSTFPFPLHNFSKAQPIATTFDQSPIQEFVFNGSVLANSDSLSGWTAMSLVQNWHSHLPQSDPLAHNPSVMQLCIFLAHVTEIQWLGVCISLAKWTWYLYRCLSRKLSIVDLRRQVAGKVAGDSTETDQNNSEEKDARSTLAATTTIEQGPLCTKNTTSQFEAAEAQATVARFHVHRPIRSLDDFRERLPVVTMARFLLVILLIRDAVADCMCCCCCRTKKRRVSTRAFSDHEQPIEGNVHHDSYEAWMQWSSICDEEIARTANASEDRNKRQAFANGPATLLPPLRGKQGEHLTEQANCGISASVPPVMITGQTSSSIASEHPTSSLAAKTRVRNWDLDVELDKRFGYDISGRHIRFEKDSWLHNIKTQLLENVGLLTDMVVCIGMPISFFLLRFLIKADGRSYDVYSERGGCRISRDSGRTDWTITLVMEAVATVTAVISTVLAGLSLFKFRYQNGTFNIDIKSLTPSAKVLRQYKATRVVRHLLILCLILNAMFLVARVIHFGLLSFNPSVVYLNQNLGQQNQQDQARGPLSSLPLFRIADRDRDVICTIVSPVAMVVLLVALGWTRFEKWLEGLFCFDKESRLRQQDKEASNKSLPQLQSPSNLQRTEKREIFAHPAFEAVWGADEVFTQRMANHQHLLRFFGSGSMDSPSSATPPGLEQGQETRGLDEHDEMDGLEDIAVLDPSAPPPCSHLSEKDACSHSAPHPSSPSIDHYSQGTSRPGGSPIPILIPEAALQTFDRKARRPPNGGPIKSPSGRVRYDPSWLPSAPVHGRPSSPRMTAVEKVRGLGSISNNRGSPCVTAPMATISSPLVPLFVSKEGTSSTQDTPTTRVETFSAILPPPKARLSGEIAAAEEGYDRVLKKLAKKRRRNLFKHGKNTVVYMQSSNVSRDYQASGSEADGDVGEECEVVTMGSISLDGLLMEEPNVAEYEFMYHKMMVESLARSTTIETTSRPEGGRGRRRSSVIRFASSSSGATTHHRRSSPDQQAPNPSFHLVLDTFDQSGPSSDLYAEK
ncbi:hypothetical protein EMPS_00489 [Entomortierella parvispora]|uniref:Uncharacterized protein n=1 Tax=Entomortierella parvispora TaxID=205924 RepID=A0A9P3H1R4_9FUNG|nr:hypothetical protein EMPS_00489 [Entomortierella parvispora]